MGGVGRYGKGGKDPDAILQHLILLSLLPYLLTPVKVVTTLNSILNP